MRAPNSRLMVVVSATALPALSTTDTCAVPPSRARIAGRGQRCSVGSWAGPVGLDARGQLGGRPGRADDRSAGLRKRGIAKIPRTVGEAMFESFGQEVQVVGRERVVAIPRVVEPVATIPRASSMITHLPMAAA